MWSEFGVGEKTDLGGKKPNKTTKKLALKK